MHEPDKHESTVQKELEVKSHKFGVVHPSGRCLSIGLRSALDSELSEVWSDDADHPVLFDTEEAARAHVKERAEKWPKSDWPDARVARYTPGLPRVYPHWDVIEEKVDEGCTHHTQPQAPPHEDKP